MVINNYNEIQIPLLFNLRLRCILEWVFQYFFSCNKQQKIYILNVYCEWGTEKVPSIYLSISFYLSLKMLLLCVMIPSWILSHKSRNLPISPLSVALLRSEIRNEIVDWLGLSNRSYFWFGSWYHEINSDGKIGFILRFLLRNWLKMFHLFFYNCNKSRKSHNWFYLGDIIYYAVFIIYCPLSTSFHQTSVFNLTSSNIYN